MIQQDFLIRMSSGNCDAVFIRPETSTPLPGVIHLTDVGGPRPSHFQMASDVAALGYAVLVPNVFYRTSRPPVLTTDRSDREATMRRVGELLEPLTPGAVEDDGARFIDFLIAQGSVASGEPIGVVGYCGTGSHSLRYAALRPEQVAAAASFHGTGLFTKDENSAHLLLPRVKARLYFGHATNDPYMPAESIAAFEKALSECGGAYESETYPAPHSWTVSDSPVYNATEAKRAFGKLTELFAATLK